jgi:cytochrome c oxidase subunit 2
MILSNFFICFWINFYKLNIKNNLLIAPLGNPALSTGISITQKAELIDPVGTIKIIWHQWYWSYEYSDYATIEGGESLNFDSYTLATNDLIHGSFRLLEVDNRVALSINTHIRLLITSADVLHSWAVSSFRVKVDATPGRLSQAALFIKREGVYYWQCSEICGVNHGFMPIVVKGLSADDFVSWVSAKLDDLVIE